MRYHTYINYQSFAKRLATHHCLRAIPHDPLLFPCLLRPWKQQSTVDPQIVITEVFKESTWVWGGGGGLDGKKAHAHSRKPPRNKDAY